MYLFVQACSFATVHPQAARAWLRQFSGISSEWIENLLARVPEDRMSPTAKKFAAAILAFNKDRLLALQEELP